MYLLDKWIKKKQRITFGGLFFNHDYHQSYHLLIFLASPQWQYSIQWLFFSVFFPDQPDLLVALRDPDKRNIKALRHKRRIGRKNDGYFWGIAGENDFPYFVLQIPAQFVVVNLQVVVQTCLARSFQAKLMKRQLDAAGVVRRIERRGAGHVVDVMGSGAGDGISFDIQQLTALRNGCRKTKLHKQWLNDQLRTQTE